MKIGTDEVNKALFGGGQNIGWCLLHILRMAMTPVTYQWSIPCLYCLITGAQGC